MVKYERIMEGKLEKGDLEICCDEFDTLLAVVLRPGVQIEYGWDRIVIDYGRSERPFIYGSNGKSYRWKQNND